MKPGGLLSRKCCTALRQNVPALAVVSMSISAASQWRRMPKLSDLSRRKQCSKTAAMENPCKVQSRKFVVVPRSRLHQTSCYGSHYARVAGQPATPSSTDRERPVVSTGNCKNYPAQTLQTKLEPECLRRRPFCFALRTHRHVTAGET